MLFALFLLSSLYISTINGWGPIGHSFVARIAQTMLSNSSQNFVRDHLPWYATGNLSMLSSWPDSIIYPESNPVDYLNWVWSKQLHYVDTPDWVCNYDRNRDCNWTMETAQNCVDGSIQNYTGRLANAKLDDVQRQEALKFLVHFIGDAHQPLHAGFTGDKGGNTIEGTFFGKSANLHKIWDTLIIQHCITTNFSNDQEAYFKFLINELNTKYVNNISQWSQCPSSDESRYLACSKTWISENSPLNCEQVYIDEQGKHLTPSDTFHLGEVYYNSRVIVVEQRLLQAGVRLATVINRIVELQKHKHHHDDDDDDDDLCAGTILFIAVVFIEILIAFFVVTYFLIRRKLSRKPLADNPPDYYTINNLK